MYWPFIEVLRALFARPSGRDETAAYLCRLLPELDPKSPPGTASIRVRDVRRIMGLWSAHFFGWPSRQLKLVGVTGTNGKTTVTYLVESIFSAAGMEPGVIGTISYRYRGREVPSHHTTPESLDLEALLAEMHQAGTQAVAMEVSSHALAQERVRGLEFDVAVFTNLSRDHLDYHADMDDYFSAKSRLFTDHLKNGSKPKRACRSSCWRRTPSSTCSPRAAIASPRSVPCAGAN